jgi:diadenosine tetraphosphate (Ap4A) HIT family hydrolase
MSQFNQDDCRFCETKEPHFLEFDSFFALWDAYPVSRGHALIVSKRHVNELGDLSAVEFAELHQAISDVSALVKDLYRPDGYNIGTNVGAAAGQTVPHFHLHIIPRYVGDTANPRGGVRNVKPPLVAY